MISGGGENKKSLNKIALASAQVITQGLYGCILLYFVKAK
jgi:hypothetical protein